MDPILKATFLSWEWRPDVVAVLALFGTLYTLGWRHLRRRGQQRLASRQRLALYWSGLVVLVLALISPIDVLGGQLFIMHMVQHLLLVMFASPLLLLANPFPFILWGLPTGIRAGVATLFYRRSPLRQGLRLLTQPSATWALYLFFLIGWHDPSLYNLSLGSEWIHNLQHLTFFGSSLLYWWHVIGAAPRIHNRFSLPARIVYLIATVPPNAITGAVIGNSSTPIYTYYTSIPRLYGLSVIDDQALAGAIMWIPGSMMYIIAALILLGVLLRDEEKKGQAAKARSGAYKRQTE